MDNTRKRILFVDDEPNILAGLQRMMRPMRDQWEMSYANGGAEALALLQQAPFDIIITDMRMPGMDGADLLKEVKRRYPHILRFVLSGYSDREMIIRASGVAHQYLLKPCEPIVLKKTIERTIALQELLKSPNLTRLVSEISILPSMPETYLQLMKVLNSADSAAADAGAIIRQDIGMSANIIKCVNSDFFGLRQHVTDPVQAAALLGLDTLKSLLMMFHVFKEFEDYQPDQLSIRALRRHSMTVAGYAKVIAKTAEMDTHTSEDGFIAGLFHDLGKLILAVNMPKRYKRMVQLAQQNRVGNDAVESAIFGATHSEVGAFLLGLWGFADSVVEACAFHHHPGDAPSRDLGCTTFVHVANILDHNIINGVPSTLNSGFDAAYLRELNIDRHLTKWRQLCEAYEGVAALS